MQDEKLLLINAQKQDNIFKMPPAPLKRKYKYKKKFEFPGMEFADEDSTIDGHY